MMQKMYVLISKFFSLQVFQYISVRSILAFMMSLSLVLCFGNTFIQRLKALQKSGQPISLYAPTTHQKKQGVPTMGGILIVAASLISSLMCGDLYNIGFLLCIAVLVFFGAIGFADDFVKLKYQNNRGLTIRQKFALQILFSCICTYLYAKHYNTNSNIYLPVFKNCIISLSPVLYHCWCSMVIVGSSNAVNLTDGLDGLASGSIISSSICMAIVSYLASNKIYTDYLHIQQIACGGDICILLSAIVGATIGFMWFNAPPAKIFMGDTGSLSIGALLGFVSVITKQELIYAVVGGVFVVEAISVIMQIAYYKITGKRLFLMAPIHHHFEQKGVHEYTIVFRCWIISIILSIIGLSMIKIR